jgi:hypothetical protein
MEALEDVVRLAVSDRMVAVEKEPSAQPYHPLGWAPLVEVASAYRTISAEVFNVGDCAPAAKGE